MKNNIQDLFITYDLAKELKGLGFKDGCLGYWDNPDNPVWITNSPPYYANKENVFLAPTWEQALNFFIDNWGLSANPHFVGGDYKHYDIIINNIRTGDSLDDSPMVIHDYKEARKVCIEILIEKVKNDNNNNL
jgi:hypothetical protein